MTIMLSKPVVLGMLFILAINTNYHVDGATVSYNTIFTSTEYPVPITGNTVSTITIKDNVVTYSLIVPAIGEMSDEIPAGMAILDKDEMNNREFTVRFPDEKIVTIALKETTEQNPAKAYYGANILTGEYRDATRTIVVKYSSTNGILLHLVNNFNDPGTNESLSLMLDYKISSFENGTGIYAGISDLEMLEINLLKVFGSWEAFFIVIAGIIGIVIAIIVGSINKKKRLELQKNRKH